MEVELALPAFPRYLSAAKDSRIVLPLHLKGNSSGVRKPASAELYL